MSNYEITCCSTCDITREHLKKIGVAYGMYHYIIDGKDHPDDLFSSSTPAEFYGKIKSGAMPTTSQVTPQELIEVIEPILKEGKDVLHIEFSSGLSGGYQSALAAQKILTDKYPERRVIVVDSLAASSGYGLLVDKAAELKREGMDILQLQSWLEKNKFLLRTWFYSDNLQHFKRGGRISGSSAAIGTLLGICPIMDVNSEGKLIVRKKAVGKKKAMRELIGIMKAQADGGLNYGGKCYMANSLVFDEARAVADMVESEFKNLDGKVEINDIGTVIGSHTGPGCVVICFFGNTERGV